MAINHNAAQNTQPVSQIRKEAPVTFQNPPPPEFGGPQGLASPPPPAAYDPARHYAGAEKWREIMGIPSYRAGFLAETRQNLMRQGLEAGIQFAGVCLTSAEKDSLMEAFRAAFELSAG